MLLWSIRTCFGKDNVTITIANNHAAPASGDAIAYYDSTPNCQPPWKTYVYTKTGDKGCYIDGDYTNWNGTISG